MYKNLETFIDIEAPAHRVWQILAKLERYKDWNERCTFTQAAQLQRWQLMRIQLFSWPLLVPVKILHINHAEGLRWIGGIPGCYTGSHYFKIEDIDEQRCRFIQGEDFNGLFVGAMWPFLEDELLSLYNSMNDAIKQRAESSIIRE